MQQGLTTLGIPFQLNTRLVRGLDYYSHTAFEITSDRLGAQSTVCGGGRYDGLISQLGGAATPAIGWALGMERLLLILEASAEVDPDGIAAGLVAGSLPDAFIVNRGVEASGAALALARDLRGNGLMVELDDSGSAFGKQFKRADRRGARWAIVLGDDEVERGELCLKPLQQPGDECVVRLDDRDAIVATLKSLQGN